jgi:hypothetical protein
MTESPSLGRIRFLREVEGAVVKPSSFVTAVEKHVSVYLRFAR